MKKPKAVFSPCTRFYGFLRNFHHSTQGNIFALGAILITPLILMMGLVIDGMMITYGTQKMQLAADAAANAGAIKYAASANATQAQTLAAQVFRVNTSSFSGIGSPSVSVDTSNSKVVVSASVTVPTYLMRLGGVNNSTTSVSATSQVQTSYCGAEVAIAIESSQNALYWYNSVQNYITALNTFITSLANNVLISITPYSTEILLDSTKLNSSNFFARLNPTGVDETPTDVYYPINTANINPWASAPSTVYTYFTNHAIFPIKQSASKTGSRSSTFSSFTWGWVPWGGYGGTCVSGNCYPRYSYGMGNIAPILPLTQNKTLIQNYITNLDNWRVNWEKVSDGVFASLIIWAWRTIDPNWANIIATNMDSSTNTYSYGVYPKNYGTSAPKYLIILAEDQNYWDEYFYITDYNSRLYGYVYYGSQTSGSSGNSTWLMTMYGPAVSASDMGNFETAASENYYYHPIDEFFGINYSNSKNTRATNKNTVEYISKILDSVNKKFLNICKNIRDQNIKIYILSKQSVISNNSSYYGGNGNSNNANFFQQCTGSSSQVFTGLSTVSAIDAAFNTIKTAINTAASTPNGAGGGGAQFPNVKAGCTN